MKIKSFLLALFAQLIVNTALAYDCEVDGIYYNLNRTNKTAEVTHNNYQKPSYSGDLVIPEFIKYNGDNYSVISIGNYAFEGCSGLTSITIPNSVTTIGESAFNQCIGLTSITIPNGVTCIGKYAFCWTGLTSITIPSSVTTIDSFAFNNCIKLTQISILNSVTIIGEYAFHNTAWYDNQSDGVVYVGTIAYMYKGTMPSNASVILKEGTTGIAGAAFGEDRFKDLASITIPSSVNFIGGSAFHGCTGLKKVEFASIDQLCNINFVSITSNPLYYAHNLFINGKKIKSIEIPNSVTGIRNYTFTGCSELTSITIPNSVTSIGDYAFVGCSNVETVTVNQGNPKYDSRDNCNAIIETESNTLLYGCKNTTIPNNVSLIGNSAFSGCIGMTNITIPNSVTSIGFYAFGNCSNLKVIFCNNPNPPSAEDNSFPASTAIVPTEALDKYKAAKGWSKLTFNSAFQYVATTQTTITLAASDIFTGLSAKIGDKEYYPEKDTIRITGLKPNTTYTIQTYAKYGDIELPQEIKATTKNVELTIETIKVGNVGMTVKGMWSGDIVVQKHGFKGYTEGEDSIKLTGLKPGESRTLTYYVVLEDGSEYTTSKTITTEPISLTIHLLYKGNVSMKVQGSYSVIDATVKRHGFKDYTEGEDSLKLTGLKPGESRTVTYYVVLEDGSEYTTTKTITTEPISLTIQFLYKGNVSMKVQGTYSIIDATVKRHGFKYYTEGKDLLELTGLKPGEWYDFTYYVVLEDGSEYTKEMKARTFPINITLKADPQNTSCVLTGTYYVMDLTVLDWGFTEQPQQEKLVLPRLEPNTEYTKTFFLKTKEAGRLTQNISFRTGGLTITTLQPKVISVGNVIVAAQTNIDDEDNVVGFEWRRTDWTNDFASNTGGAYLYDGMMEGYIRNLNAEKLWKFRPYYEAASGKKFYGEWVGSDPTNTSYFEPTVHTYAKISVEGNTAQVKGYVMRGSDNVTQQGFMYWKQTAEARSVGEKAPSIPADAQMMEATGNVMTANLKDLDYESTYCCVAFVKTSENETFYGELQTFQTGVDVSGVEEVVAPCVVTEVERYDMRGRRLDAPQRGLNIVRMSDGTVRKVVVR
jgi:hypothetical protein